MFILYFDYRIIETSNYFAIHYYLETEETWNNYCENIKRQVREGGYFTFVTFDGDILKEKLKINDLKNPQS